MIGLANDVHTITFWGQLHLCACQLERHGGGRQVLGSQLLGPFGNGSDVNQASPVDVVGLSDGVHAISAGGGYTCAVLKDDSTTCWGTAN